MKEKERQKRLAEADAAASSAFAAIKVTDTTVVTNTITRFGDTTDASNQGSKDPEKFEE